MSLARATSYRKDIDGLRALAVLPITLYHAGIPGFSGGYVGVDIFFVISGFLITAIITREIAARRFSYAEFYERRIRRIFPALSVILLFCLVAAFWILLPSEISDFAKSVIGTIFFVSNMVFFRQSGYFDGAAEDKVLLHTWSLGIEEQFYIFFPLALIIINRFFPKSTKYVIGILLIVSFLLCIFLTWYRASAAFYLLPTRAWELLAGSLIALGGVPKIASPPLRTTLSAIGVLLIVGAIALFDGRTPFPGTAAMVPVAGAALIIQYGEGTAVGRLLSIAPLVGVGLVSYSLYLWHWPLIVFGRDLGLLDGSLGPAVAVVIVSLLASYLSYRFVETPFRDRARFPRRRLYTLVFGGLAASLALSIGYLGFKDAVRARYPASVLALDDAQRDISPMRETCHPSHGIADPAKACVFGGQAPDTALWGDSHGVEFAYALGKRRHPVLSITYSSCPPAQDFAAASRSECADHNRLVARYLADSREIHTVVLAAFYTAQIDTPGFKEGVTKTVDGLVQAGKTVVIIGPTPGESERNLPKRLARGGEARITRGEYDRGQAKVIAFLNELAAKGARIVWPSDYLCDARYCTVLVSGRPLLFDEHHLSMAGAKYLAKVAAPLIWPPDREGLPARPSDQASEADVRR